MSNQSVNEINDNTALVEASRNGTKRYQPKRKYAKYSPHPDIHKVLKEGRLADELDATGNTNQPGHPAYARLRVQTDILSNWFIEVFRAYFKVRIPCEDKLYELIRLRDGSVHSVLSVLHNAVVDAKENKLAIDYPVAWCKGVLKNVGHAEYKEKTKHIPDKAESKQISSETKQSGNELSSSESNQAKRQDLSNQFAGKPHPSEMKEPSKEYMERFYQNNSLPLKNLQIAPDKLNDLYITCLPYAGFQSREAYEQAYNEKQEAIAV